MKGTRREFLGQSARLIGTGVLGAAMAGQGLGQTPTSKPAEGEKEKAYDGPLRTRTLGRTKLKISEISLGSIGASRYVVRYAVEQGVNFIHVSLGYGQAIHEVAAAFKELKEKAKGVYIGLKCPPTSAADETVEKALKILDRQRIDVLFFDIHSPPAVEAETVKATFDRLKKAGKVEFLGVTSHGQVQPCLEAAIRTGWYDCLMPAYNVAQRKEFEAVFEQAGKKDIGLVLMKTRVSEDDPATVKVLLEDKATTTICKGMRKLKSVKIFVEIVQREEKPTQAEMERVVHEAELAAIGRCAMCGTCTLACPGGLAVNDIVRSVDYYVDTMRDLDAGRLSYAAIPASVNAEGCRDCGRCERVCPNRVPVRSFVRRSKDVFS
ncbi:MAG: hypothetical protein GXY33_01705 [Phycisphaerae bacterium]|nr:hypothetical protein [Phycisphaerae bacterium]